MLYKILSSYALMILLFLLLAFGAASATFIENDFGSATARAIVYDQLWYEAILALTALNLAFVLHRTRLFQRCKASFLFHIAFVVILLGAALTRYAGIEGTLHLREGESSARFLTQKLYLQITPADEATRFFPFEINAWHNHFSQKIPLQNGDTLEIKLADSLLHKEGQNVSGYFDLTLCVGDSCVPHRFTFGMSNTPQSADITLQNTRFTLSYGAREMELPFLLHLEKFTLTRYPGSNSPSEYASELTLSEGNRAFTYTIFMNNTLTHGGYKFFQTSHDPDEKGTILTLNKDPGKIPTYIGYALLFLGLLLNLFTPASRFRALLRAIKTPTPLNPTAGILAMLLLQSTPMYAQEDYISDYLTHHREHSYALAREFGTLLVQSKGRIEPLNTLNKEILYKLSGRDSFVGMSADQVVLGMISHPKLWEHIALIRVKEGALKERLGIGAEKFARFSDFFDEYGRYKLEGEIERVSLLAPSKRSSYDNEIIKVDERLNITIMVFYGKLFKLFPLANDPNNRWLTLRESSELLPQAEAKELHSAITRLLDSVFERHYERGFEPLNTIKKHQRQSPIYPSERTISTELLYNNLGLFERLFPAYLLLGFLTLIIALGALFKHTLNTPKITSSLYFLALMLFVAHTLGLILRAYASGHAPFSDTYESMLYISWSGMLGAILLFRHSLFALAAGILIAGIFLFSAHLSHIDPQITTLVPVLKSFWLTLHVSVITASYGFFGMGAFLGFFVLGLLILKPHTKTPLETKITRLTQINEASLILGITLLVIGNFLGGIWANESWGRYWGWDPKETWSYISILIYALILHLRLFGVRLYEYFFALASMWGFGSILMTYFGVNFYLAGLHSYARGDRLPIPVWVGILTIFLLLFSLLSYIKTKNRGIA
ncbi:MAG: cytochrome c biogenesis protein CcsA [Wolinella sp.]